MKLEKLVVSKFGGLQNPSPFVFNGKSALVVGVNEAGKTSFTDALRAAFFGPPVGTTNEGESFAARYGNGYLSEATLTFASGKQLISTSGKPIVNTEIDKDLFLNLFVIKGGECSLDGKGDGKGYGKGAKKGFTTAFTKAVLGAGEVDLDEALNTLARIADAKGNTTVAKIDRNLQASLKATKDKVLKLGSLRTAKLECEKREKAVSDLKKQLSASEQDLRWAEAADFRLEANDLSETRAKWDIALEDERKLKLPIDASGIEKLKQIARRKTEADGKISSLQGLFEQSSDNEKRYRNGLEELRAKASELPDKVLRAKLRDALKELEIVKVVKKHSEIASKTHLTFWSGRLAIPVVLGIAISSLLFGINELKIAGPIIGAVLFIIIGLMFLKSVKSAPQNIPIDKSAELERHLQIVVSALEWQGDAKLLTDKLDACDKSEADIKSAIETRTQDLAEARKQSDELSEKLREAKRTSEAAANDLADGLQKSGGLASIQAIETQLVKWESESKTVAALEVLLRRKLGLDHGVQPDVQINELKAKLKAGITRCREASEQLPEDWAVLNPEILKARIKAVRDKYQQLHKNHEIANNELNDAKIRANNEENALGGDEASILRNSWVASNSAAKLALVRKAAEEALKIVKELSLTTTARMTELVLDASPIFSLFTGDRYTGIILSGSSIFDKNEMTAVHATLGNKPVEWLSDGTQDALWLSLRIAVAKRISPSGGLLVLDEPFLTLDRERAQTAFQALFKNEAQFLKGWQVLVLTKEDSFSAHAEKLGVSVITLRRCGDSGDC